MNPDQAVLGKERLCAAENDVRPLALPEGLAEFWRTVEAWCGGSRFKDDISLLAVDFAGPSLPAGSPSSSPSRERPGLHRA
jgi:hypothetical protein